MLGEESTRIEAIKADAQGFGENKDAAQAGKALDAYEAESGEKVVSEENFKAQIEAAKGKRIDK